jgi:glyoxylase-like metal-dependent hydrolase (beta-lactamase superfamily II)
VKITRITPTLVQLTRLGLINCYCVLEDDGITLIDTGIAGSADDILAAARSLGAEIKRILLTHAHGDHIGSLDALAAKLGTVEVAISRRDNRLLNKDLTLDPNEPQTKIRGSLPGATTKPTHFVEDGELYGSLRVIDTTGHTPGHMSFLDERDGSLIVGDAFAAVGALRVAGDAHWLFPLPNVGTWHKPTACASAQRLVTFPIERFACGHGKVREGGITTLQTALAHAAKAVN